MSSGWPWMQPWLLGIGCVEFQLGHSAHRAADHQKEGETEATRHWRKISPPVCMRMPSRMSLMSVPCELLFFQLMAALPTPGRRQRFDGVHHVATEKRIDTFEALHSAVDWIGSIRDGIVLGAIQVERHQACRGHTRPSELRSPQSRRSELSCWHDGKRRNAKHTPKRRAPC